MTKIPPHLHYLLHVINSNAGYQEKMSTHAIAKAAGREMHQLRYRDRLNKLKDMGLVKRENQLTTRGFVRVIWWSLTEEGYKLALLPYDPKPKWTELLKIVVGYPKTAYYVTQLMGLNPKTHNYCIRMRLLRLLGNGMVKVTIGRKGTADLWSITEKGMEWINGKGHRQPT